MRRSLLLSLAIQLSLAFPLAGAVRLELRHERKPLSEGRVCLFEARSTVDPLARLTTFDSVVCHPSNAVELPEAGNWNLFAIHDDGFVTSKLRLVENGRIEGGTDTLDLVPSALLRFETPQPGERIAAYVESTGALIPAESGADAVQVPKRMAVFPLLLSDRGISRIGRAATLEDEARTAEFEPPREGATDFAVGLAPDTAAFRRIPSRNRKAGRVVVRTGEATMESANRAGPAFNGTEALALFRGVAEGDDRVAAVEGEGWAAEKARVGAGEALRIAPTTTLTVQWSFGSNIPNLAQAAARTCPGGPEPAAAGDVPEARGDAVTLSIHRCPGLQKQGAASLPLTECSLVALRTLEENRLAGSARFDDVAPGTYLLRLSWLDLPPAYQTIEVERPDDTAAIDLALATLFGRVTHGDEPFFGRVAVGFGAVTEESTGEYVALMRAPKTSDRDLPPGFIQAIALVSCDRTLFYRHVPDQSPVPNVRFDIEIPDNAVRVQVVDAESGAPIENAIVTLAALIPEQKEAAHFSGEIGRTGSEGFVDTSMVPTNRELRICARHERYHDHCADPVSIGSRRSLDVSVRLAPADVRSGRVVGAAPFTSASIGWYSPDGRRLESTPVATDGSFQYKHAHHEGEIVVFVSSSHPLLLTRMPMLGSDQIFDLLLPASRTRTVEVTIGEAAAEKIGYATFRIGGVPVPLGAILQHNIRQRGPYILNPGPLLMGPVFETGPLEIVFGPMSYFSPRVGSPIDPFYLPEAATLERVPVGERVRISVGEPSK
jgi:hypothetical protein